MRLLVIVNVFSPLGGLEIYGRQVVEALLQSGHEVEVWSVFERGRGPAEEICQVRYLAPQGRQAMRVYYRMRSWNLAQRLAREDPHFDITIGMHPMCASGLYLASLARPNLRYWIWTYGSDIWPEWSWLTHKGLSHAERIPTISIYSRDSIVSRLPTAEVDIIPPSISLDRFAIGGDNRKREERPVMLTVSRLGRGDRYKGHDVVIRALPEIEKRLGRQVLFRIVGSGDDMADLRILAEDCGVGASVQFLGGVGDAELVEIYQNCDLFIMPSRVCLLKDGSWTGEGFGIVYIEAAACGKPVIASNQGGAADAFIDGVTGVGVNPNSVQEIVDAVFTILSDPALGQRMGEDGRRFVESNFSMEAFSERIGDLVVGMST